MRYMVTTWLTGQRDPIITYTNDIAWGIGVVRPGIYTADGIVMCIRENPEWKHEVTG